MTPRLTDAELALIRRALDEADDALGSLRRFHGAEVSALCYPARNTVAEAMRVLASRGIVQAPT